MTTMQTVELGLDTFGDVTLNGEGRPKTHAQVIRDLVEQGVLADQVGVDFIGVGEHRGDPILAEPGARGIGDDEFGSRCTPALDG